MEPSHPSSVLFTPVAVTVGAHFIIQCHYELFFCTQVFPLEAN